VTAAAYQGPLQDFQLSDPSNVTETANEIATVMENNLGAIYPSGQYDNFASCQQYANPHEFGCPWKVQNSGQVAQLGAYAAPILAAGIVYVYVNSTGIYDVEVPASGDPTPVGAGLSPRTIAPITAAPATTTTTPASATRPPTTTSSSSTRPRTGNGVAATTPVGPVPDRRPCNNSVSTGLTAGNCELAIAVFDAVVASYRTQHNIPAEVVVTDPTTGQSQRVSCEVEGLAQEVACSSSQGADATFQVASVRDASAS